ncbi:MAG: hypothetical protein FWH06_02820, partial [Oscillospiraceae bacterium]|nr:hypothetical protein [Oscillospiraceae bacterium]
MANNLPLLSALEAYAARGALRFHMPGHKGRALYGGLFADACALDVTELTGHSGLTGAAGDLYRGTPGSGDPIRRAEAL